MNISLESAVKFAAINSACVICIDGYIHSGGYADLAALDKAVNLVWVMNNSAMISKSKHIKDGCA